jgi:hypothetical protein
MKGAWGGWHKNQLNLKAAACPTPLVLLKGRLEIYSIGKRTIFTRALRAKGKWEG